MNVIRLGDPVGSVCARARMDGGGGAIIYLLAACRVCIIDSAGSSRYLLLVESKGEIEDFMSAMQWAWIAFSLIVVTGTHK